MLKIKNWITALLLSNLVFLSSTGMAQEFNANVDSLGNIVLPDDFRKELTHLGSWFVADGDASGFHDVYTESSAVDAFRRNGAFPDGATLVKELRAHTTAPYTTGANVSFANQQLKQWFVMIKDSQGRFEQNPVWGDGWGWALFKPENPTKNLATD